MNAKNHLLEICCDSLASALTAQTGGADRLELCSVLSLDGLTPSAGLLTEVKKRLSIPVFVMIRPRGGGFCYSGSELEVMLADIKAAKSLGADGIVSGILTSDNRINIPQTQLLIAAAHPLPFTVHKAFDRVNDQLEALEILKNLGVNRILTSGGRENAVAGKSVLEELQKNAGDQLRIMAGGGVRAENLPILMQVEGLTEFHSSARGKGSEEVDLAEVAALRRVLNGRLGH